MILYKIAQPSTGNITAFPNDINDVKITYDVSHGDKFTIGNVCGVQVELYLTSAAFQVSTGVQGLYMSFDNGSNYSLYCTFVANEVEKIPNASSAIGGYHIIGYSPITNLDRYVDSWLDNLTYPITADDMLDSLCQECGLNWQGLTTGDDLCNGDFLIQQNFSGTNITGRQVAEYLAELNGCNLFGLTDSIFAWIPGSYNSGEPTVSLDYDDIAEISATGSFAGIDRLWIGKEDGDLGYEVGDLTSNFCYKIYDNPLLYAEDESELATPATNLYNLLHSIPWVIHTKVRLFNYGNSSDILAKTLPDCMYEIPDWSNQPCFFTRVEIHNSSCVFESKGETPFYDDPELVDSELYALRGKYNILARDLSSTMSRLGTAEGNITTVTQTADKIEATVEGNATYTESSTVPSNPHTGDVWYDTANATYKRYTGVLWEQITAAEAKNLKTVQTIGATLDGVIYDNGYGTTVINGSNILTGTIQAARLNLTGAITYNDLTSSVQTTIDAGSVISSSTQPTGSGIVAGTRWYNPNTDVWKQYNGSTWENMNEADLPSYIKETYIDSVEIKSPTISGNTINVLNGTFNVKNSSNTITYGYLGKGSGNDGNSNTNGVILAYSGSTGLGTGDNYVIITSAGARLQAGNNGIYATNSGGVYKVVNGTHSPIGTAVFG